MRKWELVKQSQLLKIKSQILSNLSNEKYGLRLGEFENTTGTERVKLFLDMVPSSSADVTRALRGRFRGIDVKGEILKYGGPRGLFETYIWSLKSRIKAK